MDCLNELANAEVVGNIECIRVDGHAVHPSRLFRNLLQRIAMAGAQREMRAKEMCRSCPVIAQCRSHALAVGEPYGIWGGLSEAERELLLKRGIRRAS